MNYQMRLNKKIIDKFNKRVSLSRYILDIIETKFVFDFKIFLQEMSSILNFALKVVIRIFNDLNEGVKFSKSNTLYR